MSLVAGGLILQPPSSVSIEARSGLLFFELTLIALGFVVRRSGTGSQAPSPTSFSIHSPPTELGRSILQKSKPGLRAQDQGERRISEKIGAVGEEFPERVACSLSQKIGVGEKTGPG
jgi:hypothetical protein